MAPAGPAVHVAPAMGCQERYDQSPTAPARAKPAAPAEPAAPASKDQFSALLAPSASHMHVGGLDVHYEYQPNGFMCVHVSSCGCAPPPELLLADHGFCLVGAEDRCWRASNFLGWGFHALLWQLHVLRLGEAAAARAKVRSLTVAHWKVTGTWPYLLVTAISFHKSPGGT